MWPTSDAYAVALAKDTRTWATKVEVSWLGEVVTTIDTIEGGYISIDNQAVRRELHLTLSDGGGVLVPRRAADLISPKGTEITAYRGLWVDGDYEWVPLGVFGVVRPEVRGHSDGTVLDIKGFDRVDAVRKRRFTTPWQVPKNTLVTDAIIDIVTSRLDVATRIEQSTFTTPEVVFDRLGDPWDAVRLLAESVGLIPYFDQVGTLVIAADVDVPTGMVYQDESYSTLMTSQRAFDDEGTFNGVIVHGEHPDHTPVEVQVWDMDPTSPTYRYGPFGERPYGYYSELITTIPQAQAVADPLYARLTRIPQDVEITHIGHPGHDVADIITVNDPRSFTSGDYAVISGYIPLRPNQDDNVRLTCQEVRS